MFMHSDDVQVRWAEALNMGRTRQDPSLAASNHDILDRAGGVSVMDPNNVRGRYPWHTHLAGPHFARKMVVRLDMCQSFKSIFTAATDLRRPHCLGPYRTGPAARLGHHPPRLARGR
jgi:hypothetical protein